MKQAFDKGLSIHLTLQGEAGREQPLPAVALTSAARDNGQEPGRRSLASRTNRLKPHISANNAKYLSFVYLWVSLCPFSAGAIEVQLECRPMIQKQDSVNMLPSSIGGPGRNIANMQLKRQR